MSSSLVVLVTVVVVAVALLAVVVGLARRAGRARPPGERVDRAELQAQQQALGQARRPEHGYGADRTYGGGGFF
jgi:hypothetical protein